ncbi:MAG: hypothetical protein IT285_01480 [Bdellovibrionales bacterium]|nr:hypothetical protein [Bdellovibrionales bacterium]
MKARGSSFCWAFALAALLSSLALPAASRADACPTPGSLADIERWSRATMTSSGDGTVLSNGTVVDRSCYEGLSQSAAALRLSRLEAAVRFSADQADGCHESFHIADPTNVRPTLARARISCGHLDGGPEGFTNYGINHGWCPTHQLFGPFRTTAHYDRSYGITLDDAADSTLESGDVTRLASLLFHESLHHYSNQRSWHNSVSEPGNTRSTNSCSNSVFEDRIYFLQAVCFPMAGMGSRFWDEGFSSAPASCAGLCESALTDAPDAATLSTVRRFYGSRAVLANPVSTPEARIVCGRIRATRERMADLRLNSVRTENFVRQAVGGLPFALRSGALGDLIRSVARFYPHSGQLRARTRAAALAQFTQFRAQVDSEIAAICAPGSTVTSLGPTSRYAFCTDHPQRIRGAFDQVRSYMLEGEDLDYRMIRREPNIL